MEFTWHSNDILSMMGTCRLLYRRGMPILLRNRTVDLTAEKRARSVVRPIDLMTSFSLCIMADIQNRGPMVRKLKVPTPAYEVGPEDKELIAMLVTLLPELKGLRYLSISGFGSWLQLDSGLMEAVSTLRNLTRLEVNKRSYEDPPLYSISRALSNIQSPITTLELCLLAEDFTQNLFEMIRSFSATVEMVNINGIALGVVDVVYPRLKTLIISVLYGTEVTRPLISCAPNLDIILITSLQVSDRHEAGLIDSIRASGIQSQMAYTWSGLSRGIGSLDSLYALALQCPVKHIDINETVANNETYSRLTTIVQDARPMSIGVMVKLGPELSPTVLPTLVPVSIREGVTRMTMIIDISGNDFESEDIQVSLFHICLHDTCF